MADAVTFRSDLETLGFRFVQERATGTIQLAMRPNQYTIYWVHWEPDRAEVMFTWELAIGEYMSDVGLQVGSNEELNSFLYPKYDARGPQEIQFVVQEMDRVETILRGINLADGTHG